MTFEPDALHDDPEISIWRKGIFRGIVCDPFASVRRTSARMKVMKTWTRQESDGKDSERINLYNPLMEREDRR